MDGSFVFEFFVFALGWPNTKNKSPCTITDAVHRNRIRLVRTKRTCRPCRLWTELDSHWDPDILHAHKSNTIKLSLHQRSRHSQYPASLLVQHPFLHLCLCLHCLWPCTLPCCCTSIVVKSRGENLSVSSDNKAVAQTNIWVQSLKYEYRQGKQSGTTPAGKNYLPPRAGHHGITVMALEELVMADSCIPWLLFSENKFLHD